MTDRRALRRARFEALYEDHYGRVWAYARRRVASAPDADDVVAQAWLAVWLRLDDVPAGNEIAWCYGVTRRCLANHRRGEGRRARLTDSIAREHGSACADPHDSDPDPRAAQLQAALGRLRDDDAELLRLAAWERLTHAEIALVVGTSAANVAVRLHRARRRLAAAMQELEPSGHTTDTAPKGHR